MQKSRAQYFENWPSYGHFKFAKKDFENFGNDRENFVSLGKITITWPILKIVFFRFAILAKIGEVLDLPIGKGPV